MSTLTLLLIFMSEFLCSIQFCQVLIMCMPLHPMNPFCVLRTGMDPYEFA